MNALFHFVRRPLLACGALALVSAGVVFPAVAAHSEEQPSVAVSYADLDLSRTEGAATLHERIRAAARMVCTSLAAPSVPQFRQRRTCRAGAVTKAVSRVNRPVLTALHSEWLEARHSRALQTASQRTAALQ